MGGEKIAKRVYERAGGDEVIAKRVHERAGGDEVIAESVDESAGGGRKREEDGRDRSEGDKKNRGTSPRRVAGGEGIGNPVCGWFQAAENSEAATAAGCRRRGNTENRSAAARRSWSSTAAFP